MSSTTKVFCDGCECDITSTSNSVDYRLALRNESKKPWYAEEGMTSGVVTDMMIYPKIPKDAHFCDVWCLRVWLDREYPVEKAVVE